MDYKYINTINSPEDLKKLNVNELPAVCAELRDFIINALSTNPGHLGSSLGTIELTVALHYVYDTPNDKLIWDVGHQAYAHKILTGRRDKFHTNRQFKGLAPFTNPAESEYDAFIAGHASNSISAALGMDIAEGMKVGKPTPDPFLKEGEECTVYGVQCTRKPTPDPSLKEGEECTVYGVQCTRKPTPDPFLKEGEDSLEDASLQAGGESVRRNVVAIIGDGAMTGGLAFEGLNNTSMTKNNLLVVLNDNHMAIDPLKGGFTQYLVDITTSASYNKLRWKIYQLARKLNLIDDAKKERILRRNNSIKAALSKQKNNIFTNMNMRYFGTTDGHDVESLVRILSEIKNHKGSKVLHIITKKGKGYAPAENDQTVWHAPGEFNVETGERKAEKPDSLEDASLQDAGKPATGRSQSSLQAGVESRESRVESRESRVESREAGVESRELKVESRESRVESRESRVERRELKVESVKPNIVPPLWQEVFGNTLLNLARQNDKIVGITPAMPSGCSMCIMQKEMPERVFDVGIAEGHAVTFSAGLAKNGMVPFCNIYSTFLQRAYDNIVHDIALQNLHVVLCIDRAGIVGNDGATHHGLFDIAYLRHIPNMSLCAPRTIEDLEQMMALAATLNSPIAIRYPRGRGVEQMSDVRCQMLDVQYGKGVKLRDGKDMAVITIGAIGNAMAEAIDSLELKGRSVAHYDLRWVKPLDEQMLHEIGQTYNTIITAEDGIIAGGAGSAVMEWMSEHGYSPRIIRLGVNDQFVEHGSTKELYHLLKLDKEGLCESLLRALEK